MSACSGRRTFLLDLVASAVALAAVGPIRLMAATGKASAKVSNGPDYAFVVDVSKCIGCGYCVEACAVENKVPVGSVRTWVERYVATDEGVYIEAIDKPGKQLAPPPADVMKNAKWSAFIPKLCNHCEQAPCIQVCPV